MRISRVDLKHDSLIEFLILIYIAKFVKGEENDLPNH